MAMPRFSATCSSSEAWSTPISASLSPCSLAGSRGERGLAEGGVWPAGEGLAGVLLGSPAAASQRSALAAAPQLTP